MNTPANPLQQVDRTFVIHRGRKLSYFGGCDYFRLASHPAVLAAVRAGLDQFGLNVAASRRTTGNHLLYDKLETALAAFFRVEAATLVSSGYLTNLVAAQALAGEFTHALMDERSHSSLFDAAKLLDCPLLLFRHRDATDASRIARSAGRRAKIVVLTDGLFSHSGQVAPLDEHLRLLPKSAVLLVDDAHGAGTLGGHGRGTVEFLGVTARRIIQTITLSKAFGVYGGAVLGPQRLRERIISRSRLFTGNTPLPLPLANAALTAINVLGADATLRRRLLFNSSTVKTAVREAGFTPPDGPGPILPILPPTPRAGDLLRRRLLARNIHPPFIRYPGGPAPGYFRFAISSEHTTAQLDELVEALSGSDFQSWRQERRPPVEPQPRISVREAAETRRARRN